MKIQLDIFTVTLPEGASCALRKFKDHDSVEEFEFSFAWTEANAADDDGFNVAWTDMISGILYKWDSRCHLHRDISAHWHDAFTSMISCNSPVTCYFDGNGYGGPCEASPADGYEIYPVVRRSSDGLRKRAL